MYEDISSQISKITNLKYLTPVVLYKSTDKHYYISLLHRIQSVGVHYILCSRLREMDIREEIPQLIEIMLKPIDGSPISHPIYSLLLMNAKKSLSFRFSLFLRLKSVLSTVEEKVASHCYFLCCDILAMDSKDYKRNLKGLTRRRKIAKSIKRICEARMKNSNNPYKKHRIIPLTRQYSISKKHKLPDLHGLMIFFAKAVASIFNQPLYRQFDDFGSSFQFRKSYRNIQFRLGQTGFKSNVMFYENLAETSTTLKKMPSQLRQRTLRILLEFANIQMGTEIIDPFHRGKKVLNLVTDYAKTQDSAENCPFVVIIECAERNLAHYNLYSPKIKKARALLKQLESLNDLDDIGDIDGIKESIVCAIENILFTKIDNQPFVMRAESESTTTVQAEALNSVQNIDSERVCNSTFVQSCTNLGEMSLNQANGDSHSKEISEKVPGSEPIRAIDLKESGFKSNLSFDTSQKSSVNHELTDQLEKFNEKASELVECCNSHLIGMNQHDETPTKITVEHLDLPRVETPYECNPAVIEKIKADILDPKGDNKTDGLTLEGSKNSILITNPQPKVSSPLKNFDTLVTDDKFAELVPSANSEPQIIYNSPNIQSTSTLSQHESDNFIDAYSCDQAGEKPLAIVNEKFIKSIKEKLSKTSKFAEFPGWDIFSFIVKSGGVLKHEYLAYQALTQLKEIFIMEKLPIYLKNYQIVLISDTSGLVETVQDAQSIHRIKFETKFKTLLSYFESTFKGENFKKAKENFLYSLVGYSLASYILQIKDRHNGNILIDAFGHIIHVDFGFTFGKFPGIVSIENAPFKFSSEYLDLIDMEEFKTLFIKGFKALRKHKEKATRLIEIMKDSGYYDSSIFDGIIQRFRVGDSDTETEAFCTSLINNSIGSKGTAIYDHYQYFYNGYL